MIQSLSIHTALQDFAASVTAKMTQLTPGEPEDQVRGPFEIFITEVARVLGWNVVCTGETPLPDRLGRPDYAVHLNQLVAGYVELKAPGTGATASRFKGRNRAQFERFSATPNILYTDGNEWALYRDGELVDKVVRLAGDVATDGREASEPQDAEAVESLLRDFLSWNPIIPTDSKGKIDLKGFALLLAPLCRLLRDDVTDALKCPDSPLARLAKDWRQLLFPDATDAQFADAYSQTVTFALLLGRSEAAHAFTLESAVQVLDAQHNLLSRALQILTDIQARSDIAASLDLLLRVIAVVPPATLAGPDDPWLYFYEDFLAVYDPKLRKDAGAYYTPVQVVRAQVRLVDELLVHRLGKPLGFADSDVVTLDPAVGTGTYLLGVVEHALARVEAEHGEGAVAGQASGLAESLYGFERLVGPYAVCELRVSRVLRDRGAVVPADGPRVYLTDTLEGPNADPPQLPLFLQPIAEQRIRALRVKSEVPVLVCLGNPPYDRHEAATPTNGHRTGSWVRWGDDGKGADAILGDFLAPAIAAGYGIHVKNLYNLYVYFWRWALWKVFEQEAAKGPGIVSFISASSYLDGDAFAGMREHMRRLCDDIWILDLGGEGRGTRRSDNVFAIQTPVAIAVAFRSENKRKDEPAVVHYARIDGTREEKLATLDAIQGSANVEWQECPDNWQSPFRPSGEGDYFAWPLLADLMPWQQSGVKAGRTWVIAPEKELLEERWKVLLQAERDNRKNLFKDSPTGRKAHETARQLSPSDATLKPLADLAQGSPAPDIIRYAYRSFDRQFVLADARLLDRPAPTLWRTRSERQICLTSLLSHPIGEGPPLTVSAELPDLDHFRGSYGAKAVFPLYRTADVSEPNILPDLLEILSEAYECEVGPEDFLAYVYGVLGHPSFSARFAKPLETRQLRVPITRDAALFSQVRDIGARLLHLHTYGQRFVPQGKPPGTVSPGVARCTKAVPSDDAHYPERFTYTDTTQTLRIGQGEFAPVAHDVYEFNVSGLKVVQSWLKYRMRQGAGRKSSPLDDIRPTRWTSSFTTELLELLWVLEATLAEYHRQAQLFEAVITNNLFLATELPRVPAEMRKPPAIRLGADDLLDTKDG